MLEPFAPLTIAATLALCAAPGRHVAIASADLPTTSEDETLRARVSAVVHQSFRSRGFEIQDLECDVRCRDHAWAADVARPKGADIVVLTEVEERGPDRRIRVRAVDSEDATVRVDVARTCELCGRAELVELASDVAMTAARRLDAELTRAQEDAGIQSQTPAQPPAPRQQPRRALVLAGAGSTAIGLAALGSGVALLFLHAKPITRDCSGAEIDVEGNCRYLHDTRGGGIALLVIGGAATIAGATILGLEFSRPAATVRASLRPTGLAITGRF